MENFLKEAKKAKRAVANLNSGLKDKILEQMAKKLLENSAKIIEENKKDLEYAKSANLSSAMIDRLLLDENRIKGMSDALIVIANLEDPVGRVLEGWINKRGIKIEKISVPIGVVGIIYESRPNVTSDAAALCFKSGNVAILKGGKEADNSNKIIASLMQEVLEENGLPKEIISVLEDSSREGVAKLIKMDRYVDLIIPRGGEGLIRFVNENATVPVVKHDKGLCHLYVHKDAKESMALDIAINAKTQRPGVCNAIETLLVDSSVAKKMLPKIKELFDAKNTELRGCEKTTQIIDIKSATEEDFETEYLDNILSIKVVDDIKQAIEHIEFYGSGHSDGIVTENYAIANRFLKEVDSSSVYVNASTRFSDGGEFGFGAEVGISTNKLHARGPMGLKDLNTYKYTLQGDGQIR